MDAHNDGMVEWTVRLTPRQVRRIEKLRDRMEQQRGEPVARGAVARSLIDHGLAMAMDLDPASQVRQGLSGDGDE